MAVIRAVISDDNIVKTRFLLPGDIVSLATSMASLPIIAMFFWQRFLQARRKKFTVAVCCLLLAYISSFFFVFILTVVIHIRAQSQGLCISTIMLCLTLYVVSKAFSLIFLIERAHIISWPVRARHKTREYVWSCVGIFVPYMAVTGLSVKYSVAMVNEDNVCIIGIQMWALLPLLLVEVLAYLYLTIRFLIPLVMVHFGGQGLLLPLRRLVVKTTIGTGITTLSTLAVKLSLTLFHGEPAWLCCMTCKIDAIIACTILHWITAPETQDDDEHVSPQALGIEFDKRITAGRATSPSSSSNRAHWDSPAFGLKEVVVDTPDLDPVGWPGRAGEVREGEQGTESESDGGGWELEGSARRSHVRSNS